jgi:hypothetical protein
LEFRLTYEGTLLSSGNKNPNTKHKHAIRKKLHPQLKRLWQVSPYLKNMTFPSSGNFALSEIARSTMIEHLADNRRVRKYRFVPLVTEDLSLWCGIDVLFLRPGRGGRIISSGDIDNRLKTLFDALRRPKHQELGQCPDPGEGEDSFFCLLEDDSLVTKVTVEADTLLDPVAGEVPGRSDARLVITVRLRPTTITAANVGFA